MIRTGLLLIAALAAAEEPAVTAILGRPTERSASLSLLAAADRGCTVEYGDEAHPFARSTAIALKAGVPAVAELDGLPPDAACAYRLRIDGEAVAPAGFHTQRLPGSGFTFALQGDSHPERAGKMFNGELYRRTLRNAAADRPDFYLCLGDDFSIERLLQRNSLTQAAVDQVYARQRPFLALVGGSAPVFLVNGNHEQAGRHWLDGTAGNPAVLAGRARNAFFALPAPGPFYSGDREEVEHVGLLRDYYAWTWGDALFVTIDPYWHSPVEVDHDRRGQGKDGKDGKAPPRDLWQVTMGETQYRWLAATLAGSGARHKFVFTHHVLGTGRGGIEQAGLYEWGGRDRNGADRFADKRPGWELPVHQLLVKHGVSIVFQGHDHIFARQQLDGVTYQAVPNPADDTYTAFNREAYRSGDVLPDSGHLRVEVTPARVRVDYVSAFLPADEGEGRRNGAVAFSYTLPARRQ